MITIKLNEKEQEMFNHSVDQIKEDIDILEGLDI